MPIRTMYVSMLETVGNFKTDLILDIRRLVSFVN